MPALYRLLIVAILSVSATQAFADPRPAGRYDVVRLSHDGSGAKVLILDKQTGQLWTWSEKTAAVYAGQITPIAADGPFVRVIRVPQKDGR